MAKTTRWGNDVKLDDLHFLPPDIFTPGQWADIHMATNVSKPEQRLVLAVLEDALGVVRLGEPPAKATPMRKQTYAQAIEWLTDLDNDGICSLRWICDAIWPGATLKVAEAIAEHIRERRAIVSPLRRGPTVTGNRMNVRIVA